MQEKSVKNTKDINREDIALLYLGLRKKDKGLLLRGLIEKFGGVRYTWMRRLVSWSGGRWYPEMPEQMQQMIWKYIMSKKWQTEKPGE